MEDYIYSLLYLFVGFFISVSNIFKEIEHSNTKLAQILKRTITILLWLPMILVYAIRGEKGDK